LSSWRLPAGVIDKWRDGWYLFDAQAVLVGGDHGSRPMSM